LRAFSRSAFSPRENATTSATCPKAGGAAVGLPDVSPDLFIAAGAIAAERAARGAGPRSRVEDILRRAVDQAAALRGEAA
jgi:hypothetical protein